MATARRKRKKRVKPRTAVERLEEILNEKDQEIADLTARVEELEPLEKTAWMRHRIQLGESSTDDLPGLPVPRLQLRFVADDYHRGGYYNIVIYYELVYQHYLRGAGNGENYIAVPLGRTTRSGGNEHFDGIFEKDGKIRLPFREGFHIHWDSVKMGLPAYAIFRDKIEKLEFNPADLNWGTTTASSSA